MQVYVWSQSVQLAYIIIRVEHSSDILCQITIQHSLDVVAMIDCGKRGGESGQWTSSVHENTMLATQTTLLVVHYTLTVRKVKAVG